MTMVQMNQKVVHSRARLADGRDAPRPDGSECRYLLIHTLFRSN
jgi:hypothetical protein